MTEMREIRYIHINKNEKKNKGEDWGMGCFYLLNVRWELAESF
jgi:hypothetical protein